MENDQHLCHYGVLGMKWGVRRMNKINSKRRAENKRYKERSSSDKKKYLGERLKSHVAKNDAVHESKMAQLDWQLAKRKASQDHAYRQSKQYAKASRAYAQDTVRHLVFGRFGKIRYSADLKNGYSPGVAAGREVARSCMITAGLGAASLLAIGAASSVLRNNL